MRGGRAVSPDCCGSHQVVLGGQWAVWEMGDTNEGSDRASGGTWAKYLWLNPGWRRFYQLWRHQNEDTWPWPEWPTWLEGHPIHQNCKMWGLWQTREELPGAEKAFQRPGLWVPAGDCKSSMSSLLPRQRPTCLKEARSMSRCLSFFPLDLEIKWNYWL